MTIDVGSRQAGSQGGPGRSQILSGVKYKIAVASGKEASASRPSPRILRLLCVDSATTVGMLDADIYGRRSR